MRAISIFLVLAACTTTKKPVCNYQEDEPGIAEIQYRDPQSGQCQSFGSPYPCDPQCGQLCPATGAGDALPDWAMCGGACDGLSETQCLASPSCHAAYQDSPTPSPTYWGCWELPPSGAITGSCSGLDAQTCSEHTDCVSNYTSPVNAGPSFVPSFVSCAAEPTSSVCAGTSCAMGSECVVTPTAPSSPVCEPTATVGDCVAATCTTPPPGCPAGTTPGVANGCYTNYCIPQDSCAPPACATLTEQQCQARSDCDPVYNGTNCTCDRNGCTCATQTYIDCE